MKPLKITIALAVAAIAPIAAGCGEKEEPPTTGPVVTQTTTGQTSTTQTTTGGGQTDEELIRATITDFLTVPNDPTVCDELITPAFLKQSYGSRQGCVAARKPKALADQATILARKPGPGGSAIVTVKPQGGVFDAQTLKVTVVKNGQAWQIDKITSNAKVGP
ncbi:MAG: hypothetical protein U0R51_14735 [Solirubrobacterales bacterium]